jgi:hypothetical protein
MALASASNCLQQSEAFKWLGLQHSHIFSHSEGFWISEKVSELISLKEPGCKVICDQLQ